MTLQDECCRTSGGRARSLSSRSSLGRYHGDSVLFLCIRRKRVRSGFCTFAESSVKEIPTSSRTEQFSQSVRKVNEVVSARLPS